jgi:hypothetical protein
VAEHEVGRWHVEAQTLEVRAVNETQARIEAARQVAREAGMPPWKPLLRRIYVRTRVVRPTAGRTRDKGPCLDCNVETCPGVGEWEVYMVHDHVWRDAGMDRGDLCIGCLERRLGRMLSPDDFSWAAEMNRFPGRPMPPELECLIGGLRYTPRLLQRWGWKLADEAAIR